MCNWLVKCMSREFLFGVHSSHYGANVELIPLPCLFISFLQPIITQKIYNSIELDLSHVYSNDIHFTLTHCNQWLNYLLFSKLRMFGMGEVGRELVNSKGVKLVKIYRRFVSSFIMATWTCCDIPRLLESNEINGPIMSYLFDEVYLYIF